MKLNGFTELGNTLHSAMQNVSHINNTVSSELGKINADFSLTTDNFPVPIPKGDYMVDINLTSQAGISLENEDDHTHAVKTRRLQAGDRVLVNKVGTERIVVAVVTSSNNI